VYNAYAQRERQADQENGEPECERDERCLREGSDASHERGDPSVRMISGFVSHAENNRKVRAIVQCTEYA
jgi:hypothetical protein